MWPYPKIVAHRGAGIIAPENTLAAIRCGLAYGFHAVEFDVALAQDGAPVLMHDLHFGRTVAGTGIVSDFTAQTLATMDAGAWFGAQFAGEPVPAYVQVADFCKSHRIWMNVEIKPAVGHEEQTGRTVAEMTGQLFAQELAVHLPGVNDVFLPLFSSFSLDALLAAKKAVPEIPRGYLVDAIPSDWRARLDRIGATALHVNHKNLSAQQVNEVKQAGFGLFCYTVNDPQRAHEILSWGVDAFCTDRIDLIGPDFA
ncbi:MAG TPA: glycerophosphodiester phosphodiesterase [Burkholderiaceae bacterium]|nr:glycerophosphodiester phosphodiesterase [Burkholderiaceae bacterium]